METTYREFVLETTVGNTIVKREVTLCAITVKGDVFGIGVGMAVKNPNDTVDLLYKDKDTPEQRKHKREKFSQLGKEIAYGRAATRPLLVLTVKDRRIFNDFVDHGLINPDGILIYFENCIQQSPYRYIGAIRKENKRNEDFSMEVSDEIVSISSPVDNGLEKPKKKPGRPRKKEKVK